jgi:hypothetical protein
MLIGIVATLIREAANGAVCLLVRAVVINAFCGGYLV